MNLSSLDDNHRELINWLCCTELIELASASQREWVALDSLGNPMNEFPDTPRDKAAWDFVQTNGFDCDARRYAVLTIENLAIFQLAHSSSVSASAGRLSLLVCRGGEVQRLECLQQVDPEARGRDGLRCGGLHWSSGAAIRHLSLLPEKRV